MEIRVPVFAGRRILKKESLWDIRDYTYAGWQLCRDGTNIKAQRYWTWKGL